MSARTEALAHYGGCCAWCGTETGPLELDHLLQGTGNAHRATFSGRIEYHLQRQGWPPGYQLLCRYHHDLKSGRIRRMPPRTGKADLRVEIEAEIAQEVDRLASTGRTKREIVEAALVAYVEGGAHEAMLTTVQTRLDTLTARLETLETVIGQLAPALTEAIGKALQPLELRIQPVVDSQKALERQYHNQILTTVQLLNDEIGAIKKRLEKRSISW